MVQDDVVKCRELEVASKFSLAAGVTPTAATGTFAITAWTSDVALNCDTGAVAETNDVLGTLIKLLIEKGIITGTVVP